MRLNSSVTPSTEPQNESATPPAHAQEAWPIRFEWGMSGARALLDGRPASSATTIAVVVDVLSFSTTVTAALEQGASVSPSLALPSPNGSTISAALADSDAQVVAGCLRNAAAVASYIAQRRPDVVAVIAAGERWPDGSLRPAVEDLWGAGAVLHRLAELLGPLGHERFSPEARFAADAFSTVRRHVHEDLASVASGRELLDAGFGDDVTYAAEQDASDVVPVLLDGVYQAATT